MFYRMTVLAMSVLVTSYVRSSVGADRDTAADEAIVRQIAASVPSNWICEQKLARLVLCRSEEPVIINLTNGPGLRPGETEEEYRRSHAVNIKYRIVLRLGPKIEPACVQRMIAENHKVEREISSMRSKLRFGKGAPMPPRTPDEQANVNEYYRLTQSLHRIPDGYIGEFSVYIEPTHLGYASFLSDAVRAECEMVIKRVAVALTQYPIEPEKAANKG